jgi:rare lipoprotein A
MQQISLLWTQYIGYFLVSVNVGFSMMDARYRLVLMLALMLGVLSGCAETQFAIHSAKRIAGAVEDQVKTDYKVGDPYQIAGVWYYPKEDYNHDETGIASWYGTKFHGRKTANGEIYDMNALTAAHRTLPMPSYVRVTNLENGRSLVLRVNDRGPFARSRVIDVSRRGAQLLGFQQQGTAKVRVQILADKSRALKARLQGQTELAKVGSPITVTRLPKAKVAAETLEPPPGGRSNAEVASAAPPERLVSPEPTTSAKPAPVTSTAPVPQPAAAKELDSPVDGEVKVQPVPATHIFIQAGAFSRYENANKVRARLSAVGDVKISSVLIGGRDLFRVRLGPLKSVGDADKMLEQVARAGYPGARIIVE